jgi:hypothetical protein
LCILIDNVSPAGGVHCLRFSRLSRDHTPATLMEGKNKNVQFVVSRCRMSKRFSKEAGSVVDPEAKTPRRVKLVEGLSPGRRPIRMQGDALHLEWIHDSSTPRAYRATQDSRCSSS